MRTKLEAGDLEERQVELNVEQKAVPVQEVLESRHGADGRRFSVDVRAASCRSSRSSLPRCRCAGPRHAILMEQEAEGALIDRQVVNEKAVELAEGNQGIIFIDEGSTRCPGHALDARPRRVAAGRAARPAAVVVEGTTVNTQLWPGGTDHILFIAAGAFHVSKVSDLMPELQGRFPIRVELTDLKPRGLLRILTEADDTRSPSSAHAALLATEGVQLRVHAGWDRGIGRRIAFEVNRNEPEYRGRREGCTRSSNALSRTSSYLGRPDLLEPRAVINGEYVRGRLKDVLEREDVSKDIL